MTKQIEQLPTSAVIDAMVDAVQDRKGTGITIIDLSHIEGSTAPEFLICEGRSTSQVSAIADSIREKVRENLGIKPFNYDGYRNSEWIVLDYGNIMVHVFLPDVRRHYNLEELWGDGKFTEIPDLD